MKNLKENTRNRKYETAPKAKPMQYTYQLKVPRSDTLLEFLLRKVDLSRNGIKSLLSASKVLVNGSPVKQFDYPLAKDDEVKIARFPVRTPIQKTNVKVKSPVKKWIIFEDKDFLAINKPHGLLSVESDKQRECAYGYVSDYLKMKDPKARPYILHRIDKETSGVLVFTKDITLHSKLRMHWNDDIELREYYALVEGRMPKQKDTLTAFLKENQNNMIYVSTDRTGKKAVTHYEVVKENDDYSLLKVTIDTGRKNQIRVMLKDIGHPIVGDEKYGTPDSPIDRLGLHASGLNFIHPETREMIFLKAPVPAEFYNVFNRTSEE